MRRVSSLLLPAHLRPALLRVGATATAVCVAAGLSASTAFAAMTGTPRPPLPRLAAGDGSPRFFQGGAFDTCEAPTPDSLDAWRASPYGAVGIYVGGADRGCRNAGLTADWVRQVHAQGWEFLPIYVGAQAPCTTSRKRVLIDGSTAADEGRREADDAVASASVLGFQPGSAVYFDMEAYSTSDAGCRAAVLDFVSAWSDGVRSHGYVAGYYSSLDSGIADIVAASGTRPLPDALWYARWDGNAVTDGDGALPDGLWGGNRVHQYTGGAQEMYGGVSINIDRDVVDGPVGVL